mmetsp:Transcript_14986/g.34675  ORF Transcript_14986/g.34675 Transcript_14986/m.34675 type:complete len:505 (+) Transcript_14986:833-2347(+)
MPEQRPRVPIVGTRLGRVLGEPEPKPVVLKLAAPIAQPRATHVALPPAHLALVKELLDLPVLVLHPPLELHLEGLLRHLLHPRSLLAVDQRDVEGVSVELRRKLLVLARHRHEVKLLLLPHIPIVAPPVLPREPLVVARHLDPLLHVQRVVVLQVVNVLVLPHPRFRFLRNPELLRPRQLFPRAKVELRKPLPRLLVQPLAEHLRVLERQRRRGRQRLGLDRLLQPQVLLVGHVAKAQKVRQVLELDSPHRRLPHPGWHLEELYAARVLLPLVRRAQGHCPAQLPHGVVGVKAHVLLIIQVRLHRLLLPRQHPCRGRRPPERLPDHLDVAHADQRKRLVDVEGAQGDAGSADERHAGQVDRHLLRHEAEVVGLQDNVHARPRVPPREDAGDAHHGAVHPCGPSAELLCLPRHMQVACAHSSLHFVRKPRVRPLGADLHAVAVKVPRRLGVLLGEFEGSRRVKVDLEGRSAPPVPEASILEARWAREDVPLPLCPPVGRLKRPEV